LPGNEIAQLFLKILAAHLFRYSFRISPMERKGSMSPRVPTDISRIFISIVILVCTGDEFCFLYRMP